MELIDPSSEPILRQSKVESGDVSVTVGRSTYKLLYTSKLALACGPQHKSKLSKISRYVSEFAGGPGFILQKQNDAPSAEEIAKRSKYAPGVLGTPSKPAVTQFIPLSIGMAVALFNPKYADAVKNLYESENAQLQAALIGGAKIEERHAEKVAGKLSPDGPQSTKVKSSLGQLVISTAFSNFNVLRSMMSEAASQFEGDDKPQLLGQILMKESTVESSAPPMVRFSTPATDLVAVLQDRGMQALVDLYAFKQPAKTSDDAMGDDSVDETD